MASFHPKALASRIRFEEFVGESGERKGQSRGRSVSGSQPGRDSGDYCGFSHSVVGALTCPTPGKKKHSNYFLNNSFVGMVIYILVNIKPTEGIKRLSVV